ncbi:MAG TPA: hypothetical protein VIU61_25045 [Kofleriaceae bacterium]
MANTSTAAARSAPTSSAVGTAKSATASPSPGSAATPKAGPNAAAKVAATGASNAPATASQDAAASPTGQPRTRPPGAPPKRAKPPTGPVPTSNNLPAMSGTIGHTGPFDLVGPTGERLAGDGRGTGSTRAIANDDRGLAAKVGSKTGSTTSFGASVAPQPSTGPRPGPPPAPGKKVGSASGPAVAITDRLPLRADTTDVEGRPSKMPPPIPNARPMPRIDQVMPDDSETFVEDGPPGAMPRLAVPVGEFDHGGFVGTEIEADKLRVAFEQSTMKRDAANAILGLPEPPLTMVKATPVEVLLGETAELLQRPDSSPDASSTTKFERGDPTLGETGDNTRSRVPAGVNTPGGTLRRSASLRRKRGIGGDLKYVATAVLGVRRARRELVELESRQALREQSRRRHLITLGRAAVTLDGFDHPALGPAREQLAGVEDERSQHAGQVAAADSELLRVSREREAKALRYLEDVAALDAELVEVTKKLEPLEKEHVGLARKAGELRDAIRRIEAQLAATEASLTSIKAAKQDKAAIQAEIATLRADRQAIQSDEPKLASELDALSPRIAALEGRRSDARKRRIEVDKAEQDDQRRAEELLAAIGAKRKVVDRAAGDAETLRDKILFELGERLNFDRPDDLGPQLAPIDVIEVELGTSERRVMELREILSSIDKAKLARGILVLLVLLAAIGAIVWLVLSVAL